jgi:type IX secretion system PorP/SprF family membrane protein
MKLKSLLIILIISRTIVAQDIPFSNPSSLTTYINPAYTGVINRDIRAGFISRIQGNVYAPYKSNLFAADGAIYYNKDKSDFIGVGGYVLNHDDGNKLFKQNSVNVAISYSKFLSSSNDLVTIGFQGGICEKILNVNNGLHWDSQWSPLKNNWDPSANGEYYDSRNVNYYDYSVGGLYNKKINNKIKFATGISVQHLNRPQLINNSKPYGPYKSDNVNDRLPRKYTLHATAEIYTGDNATSLIVPTFIISKMISQKFILVGADWKNIFSDDSKTTNYLKQKSITFGIYYRWNDAIVPHARIEYKDINIYLAYDFTTSRLANANKGVGSYEFALQYLFRTKASSKNKPRIFKFI